MHIFEKILQFLNLQMTQPQPYGWFHLLWLGLTAVSVLCAWVFGPQFKEKQVKAIVFGTAIVVAVLEIYKQINYSFTVGSDGIVFDYQWYAFPFQFCSTPMYVGLLAGLTKRGRVHDALCAYLSTYAVFAGLCVMLYPNTVFIGTIGINIQTMVCHASMLPIGVLLVRSGYIRADRKMFLKALPVFTAAVLIAAVMNEIAHLSGLLNTETFNMFFISPYCDPSLPVYSLVQQHLPFPICLVVYIAGFSAAAWLLALGASLSRKEKCHRNKATALTARPHFAIMR